MESCPSHGSPSVVSGDPLGGASTVPSGLAALSVSHSTALKTPADLHADPKVPSSSSANWSSLFHSEKAATLRFHQLSVEDGKPSIFIPKSVHNLGISAWEDCLVGQFLGIAAPLAQIQG